MTSEPRYLDAAGALALVRQARAARRPVLGIDGFQDAGADARLDHANSIDFVGASCRTNPWAEAEAFLEEREGTALHFRVALGEPAAAAAGPRED
jgi:hypothetical protein